MIPSETHRCFCCNHGLLMPDGNTWCSLTFSPRHDCSNDFKPGRAKLYKPESIQMVKEHKVVKTKVKPVVTSKPKTAKISKPEKPRLF